MKPLHFHLSLWLLLITYGLRAQGGYVLFGSACTKSSKGSCDLLSFAIPLTKNDAPNQFGSVRLLKKHPLASGLDGQICLHFGAQENNEDRITFFLQRDTIKQDLMDTCNQTPRPNFPYFNTIDTFWAIQFLTVKDDAASNKFDLIRLYKKTAASQLTLWKEYKAPFNLDQAGNIAVRIVYNPKQKRMQLYMNTNRIFDVCIDLQKEVFGGKPDVYIAMTGQTGAQPDFLTVSVRKEEYIVCPIGNCKKNENNAFLNWIQSGPGNNSEWMFNRLKGTLTQTARDNVSFFLDPCVNWINVRIQFRAKVNPSRIHSGYFGFVWGWQDYFCSDPDQYQGNLFGWKHKDGNLNGYKSQAGKIFAKMNGKIPDTNASGSVADHFWANNPDKSWSHLAPPQHAPGDEWIPDTTYLFELEYTVYGTKLWINKTLILDVGAVPGHPNPAGQFGFYTHEQAGVEFWDVQYEYLDQIILPGDTLCQNTNASFRADNLTAGYDYTHVRQFTWSFAKDNQTQMDTLSKPAATNQAIYQFKQLGTHNIKLKILTNFNDCELLLSKKVYVRAFDLPKLPADSSLCPSQALYIDVFSHEDPKATYLWHNGTKLPAFVVATSGWVWVQKTSSDSLCVARDSMHVELLPMPDIALDVQPSCEGQSNGTIIGGVSGGSPPFVFSFQGNTSNQLFFNHLPSFDGDLMITDSMGCLFEEEVSIGLIRQPVVEYLVKDISCYRAKDGQITITNAEPSLSFSLDGHFFSAQRTFSALDTGLHTLYYRDVSQCVYDVKISIKEPDPFSVRIKAPPYVTAPGDSIVLEAVTVPGGFFGDIHWVGPQISCDTCRTTFAKPLKTAIYQVALIDAKGCSTTDKAFVRVPSDTLIYIPNVFRPGDFGPNARVWVSAFPLVKNIKYWRIFHRGGGMVFERENFLPNDAAAGWDGIVKGGLLNPGVFTYIVEFEVNGRAETQFLLGNLTLIR